MALSLQPYTGYDFSSGLNLILKERMNKEREMAKEIEIRIGDLLNEVLIIEILSWLPVKALLQFKTVCKSWYAIITSPHFISKHLQNYYNHTDSWRDHLLAQCYTIPNDLQLYELLVDETPQIVAHEGLSYVPMYGSFICGPCDGIYYVYYDPRLERALWNPATNELKALPPLIPKPDLPSNLQYASFDVYGFGLDPVTKDYKVVVVKSYWSTTDDESEIKHPLSVLIYSLRSDSWRYWGDLARPYDLYNNKCYICVNGCFYWLGYFAHLKELPQVIISFDMATEKSKEIHVPDYEQPTSKSLGMYNDSIALYVVNEIEMSFDVWSMNEGFWTKKFTIAAHLGVQWPVAHWVKNKVIVECDTSGRLAICDLDTKEMRDFGFLSHWGESQGFLVYMESLVSIKDNISRQHEEGEVDIDRLTI